MQVSRALGDFMYKEVKALTPDRQKISNSADITVHERNPEDDFLILACDGVWDVVTNQQAVSFVTRLRNRGESPDTVAEKLLEHCLKRGSTDNMSALIVYFERGDGGGSKSSKKGTWRGLPTFSTRNTSDAGSTASESEVVPQEVDSTRGRGSVAKADPAMAAAAAAAAASSAGAGAAAAAAATAPAGADMSAANGVDDDEQGEEADEDDDIIPMNSDLTRGRGSFILSEEDKAAKLAAIKAASGGGDAPSDGEAGSAGGQPPSAVATPPTEASSSVATVAKVTNL
jgi:hypothetical protein